MHILRYELMCAPDARIAASARPYHSSDIVPLMPVHLSLIPEPPTALLRRAAVAAARTGGRAWRKT
jgi:hypothetical protein